MQQAEPIKDLWVKKLRAETCYIYIYNASEKLSYSIIAQ